MNDLLEFMQRNEAALSDFEARLSAMESVLKNMQGLTMESDPSKLPVVVVETTQPSGEVISSAGN